MPWGGRGGGAIFKTNILSKFINKILRGITNQVFTAEVINLEMVS